METKLAVLVRRPFTARNKPPFPVFRRKPVKGPQRKAMRRLSVAHDVRKYGMGSCFVVVT